MSASSFTLTRDDFARLQKLVVQRLRTTPGLASKMFLVQVVVWLFGGMAGATYMRLYTESPELSDGLGTVAALLVVAAAVSVLLPLYSRWLLRRSMLSDHGFFLSPQSAELSDEGLHVVQRCGRSTLLWSAFLAHAEDEKNHYLFIEPVQAFVLPKAAVPDAEQFERLTAGFRR